SLYSQGTIPSDLISVSFEPTTLSSDRNQELSFGGTDSTKFNLLDQSHIPLTTTSPANDYWSINQPIKYGSTTILSTTAGIVDTETTLIPIANDK
ncbi:hypothetical protein EI94DRAFT_1593503, partial [Lactarius quietus]